MRITFADLWDVGRLPTRTRKRSMTMSPRHVLAVVGIAVVAPAFAGAQPIGTAFTYQGQLTDAGTPATGTYDFQFALYDAAVGGSQVGPIVTSNDVVVANGLFTVPLDFGAVFSGSKRFLDISVRPGSSSGTYTPLASRQELTPSPNAVFSSATPWAGVSGKPPGFADDVDNDVLGGLSCASGQVAKWNGAAWACAADADSGGDITAVTAGTGLTGGGATGAVTLNVNFAGSGAGTTASRSDHDHFGQTWTGAAASGLLIQNSDPNGIGVYGVASATTGANRGIYGESGSTAGIGVYGVASATTGANTGVYARSNSTAGRGVVGLATATIGTTYAVYGANASSSGLGVFGEMTATTGTTYGVFGQSASSSGYGSVGKTTATTGTTYGVYGQSASSSGLGIFGETTATTGTTYGVFGQSASSVGYGGVGKTTATTGTTYGVYGQSASSVGYGIVGRTTATTGTNYGVYGLAASPAGYAGYFTGNVHVQGTLSKSAGSFKIDHPLDPENKYLYHSFVESPDMMNVYNGNVTTGDDGYATVELPAWFGALNRDFRYQLTVLDEDDTAAFVQVKLVKKIAENRFTLRSSLPRTEVSWQVTGIRQDAFAEAHRIPVEQDKPAEELGTYLHPVEHGMPTERGRDYKLIQAVRERERPDPGPPKPPQS
jgi:hypothetical protein